MAAAAAGYWFLALLYASICLMCVNLAKAPSDRWAVGLMVISASCVPLNTAAFFCIRPLGLKGYVVLATAAACVTLVAVLGEGLRRRALHWTGAVGFALWMACVAYANWWLVMLVIQAMAAV